jgi:hypothetical protein
VPDGDRELRAEEEVQLAELDLLQFVDVAGGLEDDEEGVAVALELRPLVGLDRVLDRQLGEVVLLGQLAQLRRLRPVQTQPDPCTSSSRLSAAVTGVATRRPPE